jgi:ferredoxin
MIGSHVESAVNRRGECNPMRCGSLEVQLAAGLRLWEPRKPGMKRLDPFEEIDNEILFCQQLITHSMSVTIHATLYLRELGRYATRRRKIH